MPDERKALHQRGFQYKNVAPGWHLGLLAPVQLIVQIGRRWAVERTRSLASQKACSDMFAVCGVVSRSYIVNNNFDNLEGKDSMLREGIAP